MDSAPFSPRVWSNSPPLGGECGSACFLAIATSIKQIAGSPLVGSCVLGCPSLWWYQSLKLFLTTSVRTLRVIFWSDSPHLTIYTVWCMAHHNFLYEIMDLALSLYLITNAKVFSVLGVTFTPPREIVSVLKMLKCWFSSTSIWEF